MNDLEAITTAGRLQTLGVVVRSAELNEKASRYVAFAERGGNRAMRRAKKRSQRKRGR